MEADVKAVHKLDDNMKARRQKGKTDRIEQQRKKKEQTKHTTKTKH